MIFCHKLFRKDYAGKSGLKKDYSEILFLLLCKQYHVPLYYDTSNPITNSNSVSVYLEI